MTTMLEKAALAVRVTARSDNDGYVDNPEDVVRAALLAIREPDAAMREAGRDYDGIGNQPAVKGFTAMIDAILNEKPEASCVRPAP